MLVEARQTDGSLGTAFDGSFGVDSQDILNSPNIDTGSLYVSFIFASTR